MSKSAVEEEKDLVNVAQMNGIHLAGKRKIKINKFNNGPKCIIFSYIFLSLVLFI
jgi:cytochrome b subunit of formate dehydrogenase